MKKAIFALLTVACLFAACSRSKDFHVQGNVMGLGTQTLRVTYRTESGNVVAFNVTAVNDGFEFDGSAAALSLVEIAAGRGGELCKFPAVNGDKIMLTGDIDSIKVKGNDYADEFIAARRRCNHQNDSIADYVRSHTNSPVSTLLMVCDYNFSLPGSQGEELLNAIAPEARLYHLTDALNVALPVDSVARTLYVRDKDSDTLRTENCSGRWVMWNNTEQHTRRMLDSLRSWHKKAAKDAPVRDVYVGAERAMWRNVVRFDTAQWQQLMMVDAPIQMPLHTFPCVLDIDSLGHVVSNRPF